jgi:hypothetical protein
MKIIAVILLVVALAAFIAAAFLGATPAAARLTNVGLACLAAAGLAQSLPVP